MYVSLRSSTCFEQHTAHPQEDQLYSKPYFINIWWFTDFQGDDTRGCGDTIGPPEDEQRAARNMLRSVM